VHDGWTAMALLHVAWVHAARTVELAAHQHMFQCIVANPAAPRKAHTPLCPATTGAVRARLSAW
jgi:hypothetical protein